MAWISIATAHPGEIEAAAGLNPVITDLLYLRGQDSGQTSIIHGAPFQLSPDADPTYLKSTNATALALRKRYTSTDGIPEIHLVAEVTAQSEDDLAAAVEIMGVLGDQAGSEATYGLIDANNDAGVGSGFLGLRPLYTDISGPSTGYALTATHENKVGVLTSAPACELDVGSGSINVSGGYYQDGIALTDWTFTGGVPNKVSRTGNALVTGSMISTLASGGVAPIVVSSTTECPNLDVDYLDGYSWNPGVQAWGDLTDVAGTDTATTASVSITAGEWLILAAGTMQNFASADSGRVCNFKIKTSGGTQIGSTADFTLEQFYSEFGEVSETKSFFIAGAYTAGSTTTVRVEASITGATGVSNYTTANILAIWRGP